MGDPHIFPGGSEIAVGTWEGFHLAVDVVDMEAETGFGVTTAEYFVANGARLGLRGSFVSGLVKLEGWEGRETCNK